MSAPERMVPRAMDYPDAVVWKPTDDAGSKVVAWRPGEAVTPDEPIDLYVGRLVMYSLSREEARRLADALVQADEVAGGAA